jgi:hypothetical protein
MLLAILEEKVESEDGGQEGVLLCVSSGIRNVGVLRRQTDTHELFD